MSRILIDIEKCLLLTHRRSRNLEALRRSLDLLQRHPIRLAG